MAFTGPLEDRIAIRELHNTYADASFRADKQAWLDCWSRDPVWKSSFGDFAGKQAMADQWDRLWENMVSLAFFTETAAIVVNGDDATARCYVREDFILSNGTQNGVTARYEDELVKENGEWRFSCRTYTILTRAEHAQAPPHGN